MNSLALQWHLRFLVAQSSEQLRLSPLRSRARISRQTYDTCVKRVSQRCTESCQYFFLNNTLAPVGEPQDLRVQILNSRSARATWNGIRNNRDASRGKLLGYKVKRKVYNIKLLLADSGTVKYCWYCSMYRTWSTKNISASFALQML